MKKSLLLATLFFCLTTNPNNDLQAMKWINKFITFFKKRSPKSSHDQRKSFTQKQKTEIENVLNDTNHDNKEVFAKIDNITITWGEIKKLNPQRQLNNTIINAYFKILKKRFPQYLFFTTNFLTLLKRNFLRTVKRIPKFDHHIFNYEKVFIPLNLPGHWTLAVVDFKQKKIHYHDSLNWFRSGKQEVEKIKLYLAIRYELEKEKTLKGDFMFSPNRNAPQQYNLYGDGCGVDCGVFMLKFTEYLLNNKSLSFTQKDMPFFRKQICLALINEGKKWLVKKIIKFDENYKSQTKDLLKMSYSNLRNISDNMIIIEDHDEEDESDCEILEK